MDDEPTNSEYDQNAPQPSPRDTSNVPLILVVDDAMPMRILLRQVLQQDGYRVVEADNGSSALSEFELSRPDLVLVDLAMPQMDGVELCRRLKQTERGPEVPVVMVTSVDDPHFVDAAFEAGVTDYLSKPVHFAVLRRRIHYILKATAAERDLRHLALHDALTGLPNRVLLIDRLHQALARAPRLESQVAVFMVDLDRFKWVNDNLGHAAGDELLRIIGARLAAAVRSGDTVARLGGDEFVVVVSGVSTPDQVTRLAQKLAEEIERPTSVGGHSIEVGCSIGVAISQSEQRDVEDLLRRADAAMYDAKLRRRNS